VNKVQQPIILLNSC